MPAALCARSVPALEPAVQRQLVWRLGDNYFGRFRCAQDRCREYGDGLTRGVDGAPLSGPLRGHDGGHGGGRAEWYTDRRGSVPITEWRVSHAAHRFFAVVVRVSRPVPDDPNRASGEGEHGSDPPFFAAGAARPSGGWYARCTIWRTTPHPPLGESLPSSCIRAGRLPGPHAGRTTSSDASGWLLLTGGGMSSWCG